MFGRDEGAWDRELVIGLITAVMRIEAKLDTVLAILEGDDDAEEEAEPRGAGAVGRPEGGVGASAT